MNIYSNSLPPLANGLSDTLTSPRLTDPKDSVETPSIEAERDAELRQSATDFETAFIAQMLKFSGLTEALTSGGGEDVAAFTDFYIESFAEEIVESGGFGLADRFYEKLKQQAQGREPEIANVPLQSAVENITPNFAPNSAPNSTVSED